MSEHAVERSRIEGRLLAWGLFVAALAALSYGARLAGGEDIDDPLYRWSTAIGAAVQYAVMLAIIWAIARQLDRGLLGLRRPPAWGRAAGLIAAALLTLWIVGGILGLFLKAGEEQGLVPDAWDSSRAAPFIANFAVVAIVAPLCEELLYRGLGFGLVAAVAGPWPAIAITGLAFGLAHGLVEALPVLALFGFILAWLRWKTGSIYPGIILHALFNGAALILAVTL